MHEITRDWSADKKYLVKNFDGEKFLLRTTRTAEKLPYKQQEFAILKTPEKLDLPLPKPMDLTYCKDSETSCMLLSWVSGKELEDRMPERLPKDQYQLGITAGKILRKLHTIPAPDTILPWEERFTKKSIGMSWYMLIAASNFRMTKKFSHTLPPTAV